MNEPNRRRDTSRQIELPAIGRRSFLLASALFGASVASMLMGCADAEGAGADDGSSGPVPSTAPATAHAGEKQSSGDVTAGNDTYRGFTLDNVLNDADLGDIHFNLYVPDDYDGGTPYALFITLPGWQGLYFQGVGVNLETEDFAFCAMERRPQMIICAPQLDDWGQPSADMTVALTRYLLDAYNVDAGQVFIEGYSGGGETLSLVMGTAPELFRATLFCSSQWDGDLSVLADAEIPVYLVVAEHDEYYGSEPARRAAAELQGLLRDRGLSDERIAELVVLDVKDDGYFSAAGITNYHGGGGALFCRDDAIMGWLFDR